MVSLYTDKAREERYFRLRRRKKLCDRILSIALLASILIGFAEIAGELLAPPLLKGLRGGLDTASLPMPSLHNVFPIASMILVPIAAQKRSWILAAIATPMILLSAVFGLLCKFLIGVLDLPLLAGIIYAGRIWEHLKEQEGFPRFRIDFEEYKQREENQNHYIEQRAIDEGVREEQDILETDAEMDDLTDSGAAPQRLGAKLQRYHERSVGSDAVLHPVDEHRIMKDLEEL